MNIFSVEAQIGEKKITLETGKLAKQANSVLAKMGDTVILATCVVAKKSSPVDFLPLRVEYEEKYYASGKFRPNPYVKRETKPSDQSVLVGRFIDRTIRPLFPKSFHHDIQIILSVLSYDQDNSPDILAGIAASACLSISEAPFNGPISMVRVGLDNSGNPVINPPHYLEKTEIDSLNLIVSSVEDRIIMLEAGAYEIDEEKIFNAINFGHEYNKKIINLIKELSAKVSKPKIVVEDEEKDQELYQEVDALVKKSIDPVFGNMNKIERNEYIDNLKVTVQEELTQGIEDKSLKDEKLNNIGEYFDYSLKHILIQNVVLHGKRIGGRGVDEIRPLYMETGLLPRTHGSALFQRGETQALTTVTIGGPGNALTLENYEGKIETNYFHHYNFPPFSVGDIASRRSTGNREIGHGALAEKALIPVLPEKESFPYAIRTVSEILESNGSSSMASTCGCTLALMDAGVPIKKPVAGVAMGLMVDTTLNESDRKYVVLMDLSDIEDFSGYMDFKVAGTSDAITAIQVDMKLPGIPLSVVKDALEKAKVGRLLLIDEIKKVLPEPRKELSLYAPRLYTLNVPIDKIRTVIGKGGETINKIIKETGVQIDIKDDGFVTVSSNDEASARIALKTIENLTKEVKVGEIYEGKIIKLFDFGAVVEILPGKEGLCHISEFSNERVNRIEDVCQVGDSLKVIVKEINPQGKLSLSHKKTL